MTTLPNPNHLNGLSKAGNYFWLKRLHRIMETTLYNEPLTNLKIAEQLFVSERELFRRVKRFTGTSPQKYLKQFRLKRAIKLLKSGDFRTVKAVSSAVGYTNVSYFIAQFEREFGKKPLQVLKEHGWR